MPFPETRRVLYKNPPLDQVICQLRFPPILRIDSEIPANFQDRVRKEFPQFSETTELKMEIPGTKESRGESLKRVFHPPTPVKNYEFASEDELWKLNLTRTFMALTANKYERWERFEEKLRHPVQALADSYGATHFSRIGLRYINVIKRSQLNLQDVDWKDLLKPHIIGMLASPEVGNSIRSFENRHEIELADIQGTVRVVTSLVQAIDSKELCYMIDSDFFTTTKTPIESVWDKLDFFRLRGSRLFQWCINDRLHKAMEPQPL